MNQHSQNSIQAVVFDYGGVLCHPPATSDIDRLALTFGLPRDKFWRMYGRLRGPYDRGAIGAGEYWRTMAQCAGVLLSEPELKALHARDLAMWSGYDNSMISLAGELRQSGIKTGILSNMLADMLEKLRAEAAWLSLFDVQVYSCELGLVKPEEEIYARLVEEMGVDASRTLFVDDLPANVEAARRAGLQAVLFESELQVRSYLAESLSRPIPN
ncbi:MAG: HAD family phosphatase [Bryobacteraceae bacterium]|nr:HAD family phosphatase [Bryobacteraceae bacterium]